MTPRLSSIFSKIRCVLKKNNVEIIGGYPSYFTGSVNSICFNFLHTKNKLLSTSAGISNNEIFLIYGISEFIKPKNILLIGNSYGVSAFFFSLIFPKSTLVAIDKFRTEGIKFTNKILKQLSKNKYAIKKESPKDIPAITKKYFNNNLDIVLVDALHTNNAQSKDFESVFPYLNDNSIVILHDVINCNLFNSLNYIIEKYKFHSYLFSKSTSGMCILFKNKPKNKYLLDYLEYFSDPIDKVFALKKIFKNNDSRPIIKYDKIIKEFFKKPKHPQI